MAQIVIRRGKREFALKLCENQWYNDEYQNYGVKLHKTLKNIPNSSQSNKKINQIVNLIK